MIIKIIILFNTTEKILIKKIEDNTTRRHKNTQEDTRKQTKMSWKEISVGDTVWDIHDPKFTGTVTSLSEDVIKVKTRKEVVNVMPNMLTSNPNKVIEELIKKLELSEDSVMELRDNYWNVHQELIRVKKSISNK